MSSVTYFSMRMSPISIRKSELSELPVILSIFEDGKLRMRSDGNFHQWGPGYPSREVVLHDIEAGNSYVCMQEGRIVGTFAFIMGEDPTYLRIYEGAWRSSSPYGTIHRLAARIGVKGVGGAVINWCKSRSAHLRADTHRDNRILHALLAKHGFEYCGVIFLANGDPRDAFEWCGL